MDTEHTDVKPGHVAHVVPAVFDVELGVLGGAERYAMELARHMAYSTPTTLVTFGPRDVRTTSGSLNIRVIGNPWSVRGQSQNPFSLRLFHALRPATVVHCHQRHVLTSNLTAAFCRLTGRRVFVSDLGGGGWDLSAYVRTDNWYHGHLHLSAYSKRLSGHGHCDRAHVISGGVDVEKFSPASSPPGGGPVLFVGRLLPHKGVDQLLRAVSPDQPLEIIGSALDARYLRDLQTLAEGKHVRFRHDCTDEDLVDAYRRAMCVVLPSVYTDLYGGHTRVPELLGQTLLEGMSCGAPVICTDVASMPEIVTHGHTGFIVPPNSADALADRIRWIRDHGPEAASMGTAARESVLDRFTWPRVVERCLTHYRAASENG
jgi:glycosyltransferase involved in cell wall biosynthesis